MKDATGELSMTAVAVVAIAGIAGLFGTLIWPTIRKNITQSTYCSQARCPKENCDEDYCQCTYLNEDNETVEVTCPNESTDINPA